MERPPRSLLPKTESSKSESPNLEGVSTSTEPPAKRRCISSACMPCRKRKSKCDGVQPSCNACLTVYASQCHYDLDSDHRRKGALKRDIAQLKTELSAQNAILDALKRGSEADIDDIITLVRANPDESYESIAENIQKLSLGTKQQGGSANPSAALEGELAQFSAKPLDQEAGDLQHYGHTSNLHFYKTETETSHPGDQLESWTTVTNDTDLINHLLELYFTWSHPFYLVFSEEVFYHGLRDRKLKYCTPLLMNAILALACNFSDRPGTRANPNDRSSVGEHFFAEAKRLLYLDDRSSLTTVQALGIMSIRQAMNDHDSPGWQYTGQMVSMTIQLGLHLPSVAEPNVTATEIEARRVTFWGVFTLATAWSICVGRISSLPRAAIRLEKPCLLPHLEHKPWKPYGFPGFDVDVRGDLDQPSHKYSLLVQQSLLSEILDDIIHIFYAPRDRITSRRLQQYHEKLENWYRNLPSNLRVNPTGPTTPQVFTLNMFYHNSLIHLFRPFIKVSFVQNVKPPREICTENANKISDLMNQYKKLYGRRPALFLMSHCSMSAAIIHLVNITSPNSQVSPSVRDQSEQYVADSLRDIHQMQVNFPLVERYVKLLIGLVYKWCNVVPLRIQEAIADVDETAPGRVTSQAPQNQIPWHPTPPHDTGFAELPPRPIPNQQVPNNRLNSRKHSAPDLVQMAPVSASQHPHISVSQTHLPSPATPTIAAAPPHYQQQLFWTPFPENFDGVPLPMLETFRGNGHQENVSNSGTMSVTGMLGGQFPQLSQDGFMLVGEEEQRQHRPAVSGADMPDAMGSWPAQQLPR